MKSKLEKDKAAKRKAKKTDPAKPPPKAKAFARKPVSGNAVHKESASGSRPEQAEAESGLPDKPPVESAQRNPSDIFEDDEAWERTRDSMPEQPLGGDDSGLPDNQIAGTPEEQAEPAETVKLPIGLRRIHDKLRDPTELYKLQQLCRYQRISTRPMANS